MVVWLFSLAALATGAGDHLIAGARDFRAGRFAEALVQFRVAEKLGGGDEAAWYSAACLVRLKRPEEAVEAFAAAERRAPGWRDDLFDYYHAVACSDARLYRCADKLLAKIGSGAGPRIAGEAAKLRASIEALLRAPAGKGSADWYRLHAQQAEQAGQPAVAKAHRDEAEALAAQLPRAESSKVKK